MQVVRRSMEFLRAEHQVYVGQPVNQFASAALRHATQESEQLSRPLLARLAGQRGHFSERLLLGHVAHRAGVEQDYIRDVFGPRQRIALGHELRGDRFAVALVHLATVSFNVNTRHTTRVEQIISEAPREGKAD